MATREIAQEQWTAVLDSVSVDYRSQPVSVHVSDPELGYQVEMKNLPLVGVSADLKAGGGPRVEVIVGRTDFTHTTHSVINASAVRIMENDAGEPEVIEIESRNQGKTLVILRPGAYGEPGAPQERGQRTG